MFRRSATAQRRDPKASIKDDHAFNIQVQQERDFIEE